MTGLPLHAVRTEGVHGAWQGALMPGLSVEGGLNPWVGEGGGCHSMAGLGARALGSLLAGGGQTPGLVVSPAPLWDKKGLGARVCGRGRVRGRGAAAGERRGGDEPGLMGNWGGPGQPPAPYRRRSRLAAAGSARTHVGSGSSARRCPPARRPLPAASPPPPPQPARSHTQRRGGQRLAPRTPEPVR